jgi:hypothetical protein
MEPPGILTMGKVAISGIRLAADDHFDDRLDVGALRKIAIMCHDHPDMLSRIGIRNQSQRRDGVDGQDMTLAPRNPSIPLPHL